MVRMSTTSRHQHASPSVSVEKGAFRLYAPIMNRSSPSKSCGNSMASRSTTSTVHSQYEKRLALLLVSLALAASFCFGSAYYLFRTRWESPAIPPFASLSDLASASSPSNPQVIDFDSVFNGSAGNVEVYDSEAKYLAYLPHSGFHNQRIAFENALVLARILNRTLLVPPVRLGKSALRYGSFQNLKAYLKASDKTGRRHCANVSSWSTLPVECGDYFDYTFVPWDWLVNLDTVRSQQPLISRSNMSDAWLEHNIRISNNDTFSIKDRHQYHFRFVDNDLFDIAGSKYDESASISLLSQVQHRLLHLGTLHGSSRLRLRVGGNIVIRTQVRKAMTFTNPYLISAANYIGDILGGGYLSVHLRMGDDHFQRDSVSNVRLVWWKLLHKSLGMDEEDISRLEEDVLGRASWTPPRIQLDLASLRVPHPPPAPLKGGIPQISCRGNLHSEKSRAVLNTPLYISTDVRHPEAHPALAPFLKTFPCTYFLSDFKHPPSQIGLTPLHQQPPSPFSHLYPNSSHSPLTNPLQILTTLQSPYDSLMLNDFLLPFLDATVAGRAWAVVGTPGSTFSQFVEDVLWREWKGWDIVQRG